MLLPDVGGVGQRRLFAARALVRDAAGPAIVYLAAAGVGTIVLDDAGTVAREDVGWLFELEDVGRPRREAARARIAAMNPDVRVEDAGDGTPVDDGRDLEGGARAARDFLKTVLP